MSKYRTLVIDDRITAVRERLEHVAVVVASTWFPTRNELGIWTRSSAPLYLRRRGPEAFDLGPRLESIMAASFCPVWKAHLMDAGEQTRLEGRIGIQPVTIGMFVAWGVVLVGWLMDLVNQIGAGQELATALVWWVVAVAFTVAAGTLGVVSGGRELDQALQSLPSLLSDTSVGEEDW